MAGDSGGGGESTTTTTEPWEGVDHHLKFLYNQARSLYNQGVPDYYGGTAVAPYSPAEQQAIDLTKGPIAGGAAQLAQSGMNTANFFSGPALDPNTNPYLQQYAEGAVRPLYQNLNENVLPNIGKEALSSGIYGGNRQGIAEGLAAGRTAQAAGDTTSKIYNDAYSTNVEAAIRNLALLPQTQSALGAPAQYLSAAGGAERNYQQALLNEEINKWIYQTAGPYNLLAQLQNFLQGSTGSTVTANAPGTGGMSPLAGAAGGATTGALAGAPFAGATYGLSIPIGALIGGLGGYFATPQ